MFKYLVGDFVLCDGRYGRFIGCVWCITENAIFVRDNATSSEILSEYAFAKNGENGQNLTYGEDGYRILHHATYEELLNGVRKIFGIHGELQNSL